LTKVGVCPYPALRRYLDGRPREAKVTIALGFCASDGIALCTDSEINKDGGLKYNDKKIHPLLYDDHAIAFAYSGSPEIMDLVLEGMKKKMTDAPVPLPWLAGIRGHLESVLLEINKKHKEKYFEVLCAATHRTHGTQLYCGKGKLVREAGWECLGVGDTSVVRYLSALFQGYSLMANQCLLLGYYIVAQAKEFTPLVGGPTQGLLISNGTLGFPDFDDVQIFAGIERSLVQLLVTISNKYSPEEKVAKKFKRFEDVVREIDWTELESN
jgi:hypothetical protein